MANKYNFAFHSLLRWTVIRCLCNFAVWVRLTPSLQSSTSTILHRQAPEAFLTPLGSAPVQSIRKFGFGAPPSHIPPFAFLPWNSWKGRLEFLSCIWKAHVSKKWIQSFIRQYCQCISFMTGDGWNTLVQQLKQEIMLNSHFSLLSKLWFFSINAIL